MKNLILITLVTLIAAPAFARSHNPYTIDMSGRKFVSTGFNLMDDGIPGHFDGIQLKLSGAIGEDFEIAVSATNPEDAKSCRIGQVRILRNISLVEIEGSPETDTGDTCDFTIVYKSGSKAIFKIESTGT